ncbi:MAG: hypothetical protein HOC71_13095 [Candidatus Latescibacteria bacterium]|jgi:hypothetical protein|nr:hypothetical protein [Candidatus Latescibacterota bacterium]
MEIDLIVGSIIIVFALGFIMYLTLWSRKTIELIAEKKLHSIREILEKLHERR